MNQGNGYVRRMLAALLMLTGLYIWSIGSAVALPSLMMMGVTGEVVLHPPLHGEPMDPWVPVTLGAVGLYFLVSGLPGVLAMLAGGNLWWNGSRGWMQVCLVAGLLGTLGQALPGVLGGAAGLYNGGNGAMYVGMIVTSAAPTVAFAGLVTLVLIVTGGPPAESAERVWTG